MTTPLVKIDRLTKTFESNRQPLQAVSNVSLSISSDEIIGLAGESGSGKSTLGKLSIGLIKPTSGSVKFAGEELSSLSRRQLKQKRQDMQLVFQNPSSSLDPRLTVENILLEPLIIHGIKKKTERLELVEQQLLAVGLRANDLRRLPHELSGGQKQRLAIARALILRPRFLVCDEPLSALDLSIQAQILNLLKRLQKELGLTCLFISHDLTVMRYLTDRIAIMHLGEIIELAPSKRLYQSPLHPYTQALLSAIPIPDPQAERSRSRIVLKGDLPSPLHPPSGCRFHTRCPFAQPICRQTPPQWKEVAPEHFTACHFVDRMPLTS